MARRALRRATIGLGRLAMDRPQDRALGTAAPRVSAMNIDLSKIEEMLGERFPDGHEPSRSHDFGSQRRRR